MGTGGSGHWLTLKHLSQIEYKNGYPLKMWWFKVIDYEYFNFFLAILLATSIKMLSNCLLVIMVL